MEKEKLIAKFKDYSKELEKILIDKPYSKTAKNLLLNMFYKIENAYDDYKKIKVEVPAKKEALQELLDIIYRDCKNIELIKPKIENDVLEYNESQIVNGKILTYQNELSILEQLYRINSNKFVVNAQTKEIGDALSNLLNNGEVICKSEVLRDFDGWSWNPLESHDTNKAESLVYTGFSLLMGHGYLTQNKQINIEDIEEDLKKKYKNTIVEKIIKCITQIAITEYLKEKEEKIIDFINKKKSLKNGLDKPFLRPSSWQGQKDLNPRHAVFEWL